MCTLVEQIRALPVTTTFLNSEQVSIRIEQQSVADALAGAGYLVTYSPARDDLSTSMVVIVDPEDGDAIVAELGSKLSEVIAVLTEEFANSDSLREPGSKDCTGWYHELTV